MALGVCDELAMMENALYSVISPRGCASILWKDASKEKEAANILHITAEDLLELQVAEHIISEPAGGSRKRPGCQRQQYFRVFGGSFAKTFARTP